MHRAHKPHDGKQRESPSIWDTSDAWAACAKALRDYDEDIITRWKEEIDTLLVFAGLFSAVVTTFNIEAYKLLQQQPEDSSAALLAQISAQLKSITSGSNITDPETTAVVSFKPSAFAIRLNTLWFSSLVCSLLSASLGLLVKQWLREYLAGASSVSRESIRVRQFRHDGLRRWHVSAIILFLPILLQVALLLFLAGLLDLLWTLHPVVASVVTALVAVAVLFHTATIILPIPSKNADCPYRSPQSWALCATVQAVKRVVASVATHYHARLYNPGPLPSHQSHTNGHGATTPDPFASRLDLPHFVQSKLAATLSAYLHRLSLIRTHTSWRDRERRVGMGAALDGATLAGADAAFVDDAFLRAVVRPCIADVGPRAAFRCVDAILLRRAPRVLNDMPYWETADGTRSIGARRAGDPTLYTLMHLLLDVLQRLTAARAAGEDDDGDDDGEDLGPSPPVSYVREDPRRRVLMTMDRLARAIPSPPAANMKGSREARQVHMLFRRIFDVLSTVLAAEVASATSERFIRERAFNLMLKMFPRFQEVGPTGIEAFCAYGERSRSENAPYRFVQATYMAVRAAALLAPLPSTSRSSTISPCIPETSGHEREKSAISTTSTSTSSTSILKPESLDQSISVDSSISASSTLYAEPEQYSTSTPGPAGISSIPSSPTSDPSLNRSSSASLPEESPSAYISIRPSIVAALSSLTAFMHAPTAEFRPTPATLAECAQAALALASRDRGAVSRALVDALGNVVRLAEEDIDRERRREAGAEDSGARHDIDVAAQAVRVLRTLCTMGTDTSPLESSRHPDD
ncbi:uncharacterized protein BXZ73DRAFT_87395 [Epithele typhae]|uniref:uncharacterized protein n=1 Tax=Epithele typhae TaxID=378194 RepID=UPI0020085D31|nr:uncharacterized protein BXZ73DRAFT_87395 [Epithele typhae]KAH9944511.1 hypothetical protein BXZ73DRAFT_87395 [Epithele typhae]